MEDPHIGMILIDLLILVFLVLTNAFFAMSEIAILQSNQNRIKKLAEEKGKGAKRAQTLLRITADPTDFLSTIQVGVTLSGFLASAVAADKFAGMLAEALSFLPIARGVVEGVSLVVITLLLSYFTLVFGELVPKRIAMKSPDRIALSTAGILNVLYRILRPVIRLLSASTNAVSRLFGIRPGEEEEEVTEEDILLLVEEGTERGSIQKRETEMIHNIFDLNDKLVSEVMTPRVDIAMVNAEDSASDVLRISKEEGYSRIPAYEGDFDNIVGIVYIKDLIGLPDGKKEMPVRPFLRKPIYVPEGKLCSKLLLEFQEHRTHMAIVIDEFGGTAGLVTLEDLLEIIVGDIADESDPIEPPEMEREGEDYLFDGEVPLEEATEALKITLEETFGCDTIGGYVMTALGHIPSEPGRESVPFGGGYAAVPLAVEDRRISRVRVFVLPPVENPAVNQ